MPCYQLVEAWREMSPIDRAHLADRLSVDISTIAKAGIRLRHPDMTEADLVRELARRRYGSPLTEAAFHHPDRA